jgi:small subunit ribosomal protein S20
MANHASAVKRNRQRLKRTARNRAAKSALRTEIKRARSALASVPKDAPSLVTAAISALDRAASKGTIPVKRASRLKGRLTVALNKARPAAS